MLNCLLLIGPFNRNHDVADVHYLMTWWVGYKDNLCRYKLQMPGQNQWHLPQVESVRKNYLSGYTFRNAWNRHISWCLDKDGTLTEEQTIDATASTCFISSLGMSRAAYAMASWTIGAWVVSRNVMQCLFFVICVLYMYRPWVICSFFTNIWYVFKYCEIYSQI